MSPTAMFTLMFAPFAMFAWSANRRRVDWFVDTGGGGLYCHSHTESPFTHGGRA
jgi:hypothetical protein